MPSYPFVSSQKPMAAILMLKLKWMTAALDRCDTSRREMHCIQNPF
jgi:hypothetical protein